MLYKESGHLAILMCTYNGELFLKEQLDSFQQQSFKNWELFVYDDNSKDHTKAIIETYKTQHQQNQITLISNQQTMGFSKNFLQALCRSSNHFDFFAISDQDDIWCEEKLERAVNYLKTIPSEVPAVYCSRTILIDTQGKKLGFSPLFKKPPSFKNALVQCIAGGNTFVINHAAKKLVQQAGAHLDIVSHDWWIYQLITAVGGVVYYDREPQTYYRQHGANLVGSNLGMFAKITRIKKLFNSTFKESTRKHIHALKSCSSFITKENNATLDDFIHAREGSFISRLRAFFRSGVYWQTKLGNCGLFIGGVLNKL